MQEKLLRLACYTGNLTMALVGALSPLLFLTFRETLGISYSLLGLLVLANFVTQLLVDLVFSFFSHRFHIPTAVKTAPILTVLGLLIYALWPFFFPDSVYVGLFLGTVLFSAASGFNEVLLSPIIAALPSKDPERDMSRLHAVYAWGVVGVVGITTVFLTVFSPRHWQYLVLFFTLLPLFSFLLFFKAKIPNLAAEDKGEGMRELVRTPGLWLSVFCIFLGGSAECTMAQWSSGYLERALGLPKSLGDVLGVAMFAVMLGLGRSLYGKFGKNVEKVLVLCMASATLLYLVAALSPLPWIGLAACAMTGFATSMLWPGNLSAVSARFPGGGVFLFAMMAAGGDLGASVGPQMVGAVTDLAMASPFFCDLAASLGMTGEQLGMKAGILLGALFPLIGIFLALRLYRNAKKRKAQ